MIYNSFLLGNVTYNRHTYTVPHSSTFTLETEWGYDSWGRIHYITYPDKEIVYYSYDKGGNLQKIRGEKLNQPTVYYIKDIKESLLYKDMVL